MPFLDKFPKISVPVLDDAQYTLSLELGDGIMNGTHSFFNFNNDLITGNPIIDSPLGKGRDIRGKKLRVRSTFVADNPAVQFVSVIYTIKENGTTKVQKTNTAPVGADPFFTFIQIIEFV